jgi:formylmethanofuran dehydrogenase subunit D
LKAKLLTGRSILQGIGKEYGKLSDRYQESVSICNMCAKDMKEEGIENGKNIRVKTDFGSVILKCVQSDSIQKRGIIFIPCGPYAEILIGSDTECTGTPTFKGISAEIEVVEDKIIDIKDLLNNYIKK